jgi:hypothetical protein
MRVLISCPANHTYCRDVPSERLYQASDVFITVLFKMPQQTLTCGIQTMETTEFCLGRVEIADNLPFNI